MLTFKRWISMIRMKEEILKSLSFIRLNSLTRLIMIWKVSESKSKRWTETTWKKSFFNVLIGVQSKMMAPGTRDCVNMTGAFQQQWGMTMDTLIAHVLRRGNSGWNKSFWLLYWSCIWNPEASSCKVGQTIASKISVKFVVQSWQSIRVTESSFLWPVSSVSQYLYSV